MFTPRLKGSCVIGACAIVSALFSLAGCVQRDSGFGAQNSKASIPTRALYLRAQYPLQSQGAYFSVRQIHEMGDTLVIAGSRWQSSGLYGYITIPKVAAATFSPILQPMTPLFGYGGQGCTSGDKLFDLNWSSAPQGMLTPAADGTMNLLYQSSVFANQVTGCVWDGDYIYAAGNDSASRIWIVDTRIAPLSNASIVGTVDLPNATGSLVSLKIQNGRLFAKSKYHNLIYVYSLANPGAPTFETSFSTLNQGSFDIAVMNDLWVDAGYIISSNLFSQTIQIFSAAAPYDQVRMFYLGTKPSCVYRWGNLLFVGSTTSTSGGDGQGFLDVFAISTGEHLASTKLNQHLPTSLWSDGRSILVGGIWPLVATDPGLEVYDFR